MRRTRAVFAYGAALAPMPYLLIKVSWVAGTMLGLLPRNAGLDPAAFVLLNVVTIGMSATAAVLGLAMIRPWGRRIPALPLLTAAWIGCGFLVPLLPYLLLTSLPGDAPAADDGAAMPRWEGILIQLSFLGITLGLAGALPGYVRDRWAAALTGRVGDVPAGGAGRGRLAAGTAFAAAAVGSYSAYWTVGGTAGLAHPVERDYDWYLLVGTHAICALAGAWSVWTLHSRRPAGSPLAIPVAVAWLASGYLVAWSVWKLPFTAYFAISTDPPVGWPENLRVLALLHAADTVAGAAIVLVTLRVVRARRIDPGPGGRPAEPATTPPSTAAT